MTSWTVEQEREYRINLAAYHAVKDLMGLSSSAPGAALPVSPLQVGLRALQNGVQVMRKMRRGTTPLPLLEAKGQKAAAAFVDHLRECLPFYYAEVRRYVCIATIGVGRCQIRGRKSLAFVISPLWEVFPDWHLFSDRILLHRQRCEGGWKVRTALVEWKAEEEPPPVTVFEEFLVIDPITHKLYFGVDLAEANRKMAAARVDRVMEAL